MIEEPGRFRHIVTLGGHHPPPALKKGNPGPISTRKGGARKQSLKINRDQGGRQARCTRPIRRRLTKMLRNRRSRLKERDSSDRAGGEQKRKKDDCLSLRRGGKTGEVVERRKREHQQTPLVRLVRAANLRPLRNLETDPFGGLLGEKKGRKQ